MLTHVHSLQRTQPQALKRKPVVGFHAGRESQLEKIRNILRGPVVQPQLKIGAPNDKYEQEADRVAEQVMRMPEPQVTASSGIIQRACTSSCLEENRPEEGMMQTKPIMSLKSSNHQPSEFVQAPSIVHDVLRSSGQPLDEKTRAFMEPRFGYDFSQVRVHTDDKAGESARAVNARAYTVGQDVVMRREEYAPTTNAGRRLLAHELVHVVQQRGNSRLLDGRWVSLRSTHPMLASRRHLTTHELNHVLQQTQVGTPETPNRVGYMHSRNDSGIHVTPRSELVLSRADPGTWVRCRQTGVPCPTYYFGRGAGCLLVDCIRAKTADFPFAISPGVCIFRCPDGTVCACVLFGNKTNAICTFTFCNSQESPNAISSYDDLANRALAEAKLQMPGSSEAKQA